MRQSSEVADMHRQVVLLYVSLNDDRDMSSAEHYDRELGGGCPRDFDGRGSAKQHDAFQNAGADHFWSRIRSRPIYLYAAHTHGNTLLIAHIPDECFNCASTPTLLMPFLHRPPVLGTPRVKKEQIKNPAAFCAVFGFIIAVVLAIVIIIVVATDQSGCSSAALLYVFCAIILFFGIWGCLSVIAIDKERKALVRKLQEMEGRMALDSEPVGETQGG